VKNNYICRVKWDVGDPIVKKTFARWVCVYSYYRKSDGLFLCNDLNDFTYTQIQNIILEESLELTEFISEVDISWSYDDRYTIENQHGNGKG
jgi:hypothetical protein